MGNILSHTVRAVWAVCGGYLNHAHVYDSGKHIQVNEVSKTSTFRKSDLTLTVPCVCKFIVFFLFRIVFLGHDAIQNVLKGVVIV